MNLLDDGGFYSSPDSLSPTPSPTPGASSVLLPLLHHHNHDTPSPSTSTAVNTPTSNDTSPSSPILTNPAAYLEQARLASGSHSTRSSFIKSPVNINRIASEESQVLGRGNNGSMLLYRLAGPQDLNILHPNPNPSRFSQLSLRSQAESVFSNDSKYPRVAVSSGIVAYAFDPDLDEKDEEDDEDYFDSERPCSWRWSWRGITNLTVISTLILLLLLLFIFYPIHVYLHWKPLTNQNTSHPPQPNNPPTTHNPSPQNLTIPNLIDPDTPPSAYTRLGYDEKPYTLIFSDEFTLPNRTFYPGDDPYWEAVNLWYDQTSDLEFYDPRQVFTQNGNLVILLEQEESNGLQYRSGMLQGWNKFCFSGGYVEVRLSLPGESSDVQGYWPGIWLLGNLARPGYSATTDGVWPYTYTSCDVGTLPMQTYLNASGPAAALYSDASTAQYNNALSGLPGQKLSACTCPNEDHPGPVPSVGRGAPEIDILEAEKNKLGPGGSVSQSAQFAPFTHDYDININTDTGTTMAFNVYNESLTRVNTYKGSPLQQAISTLTQLPDDIFNGTGGEFYTFGVEYHTNPSSRDQSFITWQMNGTATTSVTGDAVGPDMGDGGTQVGQRLISEEPMALVLNLAISNSFQQIDFPTLTFPASLLIDYVRIYQRTNEATNIGCDPPSYPTADYINRHMFAYTNPNLTMWGDGPSGANLTYPRNSIISGGC